jgi:hypothetical protein
MTKLDTAHVLPVQPDLTREACIRQKVLPAPSPEPETITAPEVTGKAVFEGRWLVITDLGDCIVDHVVSGCSEHIRKVPVKTLGALVASVSQFVVDISNQRHEKRTMHALALTTFQVLVFRCGGFSVAAVLSKSSNFGTAAQYKAHEIAIALNERVGEALTQVVEQLQSNNDDKMHSFTLESMLDSADEDHINKLLDPRSQGISESVFQDKLNKSHGDMLRSIITEPSCPTSRNVCQACICDHRGHLLTLLTKEDTYLAEHSSWDHASKFLYSTAQKLSCSSEEESIFSAASQYGTSDVLSKVDADGKGLLSLWLWEATTPVVVGVAGPLRICIQLEDSHTGSLPTQGDVVVVSPSLNIWQLLSEEQPALSLQLLGDLSNTLYTLSMALDSPREKPTLFVQHATILNTQSAKVTALPCSDSEMPSE